LKYFKGFSSTGSEVAGFSVSSFWGRKKWRALASLILNIEKITLNDMKHRVTSEALGL
jgi:hypothetical protein